MRFYLKHRNAYLTYAANGDLVEMTYQPLSDSFTLSEIIEPVLHGYRPIIAPYLKYIGGLN